MRKAAAAIATVVLAWSAGSAPAQAATPLEGSWKGESSAKLPIFFGVSGGHVVNIRLKFKWGFCGTFEIHDPGADQEIDSNGHWTFEDPRGQTVEGTFVAPDRVEGKVISMERELPGCPRTEATFTAVPVPTNPESLAAARAGIEALPYRIDLRHARRAKNALIGKVSGDRGESFSFFLFVNRKPARHLRGVPGYAVYGPRYIPGAGIEGGKLANTDYLYSTAPRNDESKAQKEDHFKILGAVKDTICVRQTGDPCPVPG